LPDAADDRVIVYLHGGGFQVGSIASHLAITSRLTGTAKARVLALDYRLAPEVPESTAAIERAGAFVLKYTS
jgi:epsilon-lactone hydrolase